MVEPAPFPRVVGRVRGAAPGPLLLVVGGIHGNEPAGLHAAQKVLPRLDPLAMRGDFVVLAGNVRALAQNRRFLARDLNRQWSPERMAAAPPAGSDPEALEQRELSAALAEALASARGPVFFLELHTTSAEGIPFALVGDTLPNRDFAARFPLPVILGLEEQVDGVLAEFMSARGCVTLVVEGGQHQSQAAAQNLESVLWLALEAVGLVPALPACRQAYAQLDRARAGLPRLMEVLSRHPVQPDDGFRMEPGFANIARVSARQLLARDRSGDIRAHRGGFIFLPLYQAQGEDGFFVGRAVGPLSRRASALVRWARLDRLLGLLPGVRPVGPDELDVTPRAAAFYPSDLFRLFGYRIVRPAGPRLSIARRATPRSA
ncbi:MAG TPA: succinylglutamate desuccinylase/aspartoacylase family protein [Polyangia bacterium]|nr:succinylglutamate desuccinylase/aspartoacylase family protein [Polyangia bacterium]